MRHFVADDAAQDKIGIEGSALRAGDLFGDFEICTNVGHVPHPPMVRFGNDLRVAGRMRMDVEEGKEILVLVDDMSGDLFIHDFAEDAVGHMRIIAQFGRVEGYKKPLSREGRWDGAVHSRRHLVETGDELGGAARIVECFG